MADYGTIINARDAWRDAERAYYEEAVTHWVWQMEGASLPERYPEPVTTEERARLARLRQAADRALAAFQDALGNT
jgi:hypothetical protein